MNKKQKELLEDLKYKYVWCHSHLPDLIYHLVKNNDELFERRTISLFQMMTESEFVYVLYELIKYIIEVDE